MSKVNPDDIHVKLDNNKKTENHANENIELKNDNNIYVDDGNVKEPNSEEAKIKSEEYVDELSNLPGVGFLKLQFGISDFKSNVYFILGILGACSVGAAFPIFALVFGDVLNNISMSDADALVDKIGELAVYFVYVGIGMGVGHTFLGLFMEMNKDEICLTMKKMYFKALMRQEQAFFDSRNCFEYSTKVQTQIKTVSDGLGLKVGNTATGLATFIAAYIVGFVVSWKLSLVLVSIVPFLIIAGMCMVSQIMKRFEKSREAYEKAGGIAEEVLYNIKTVISFGNFFHEKNRFEEKIEESYQKSKFGGIVSSLFSGLIMFLIFGGYALAVGVGGKFIADREYNDNSDKFFAVGDIITILFTIVFGAFSLGQSIPNVKAISAAADASREFFYLIEREAKLDLSLSKDKPDKESIKARIEFKNVNFYYPSKKDRIIFEDLSMVFEAGKTTAIVGETGSGKSTIVNLIERLYDPTDGTVTLDDKNIKEIDLEYLRNLIGYVPQEPILIHSSIKENIKFGRDDVTDEEVHEACEKSLVNEFLNRMDNGIDSKVGIKGSRLSGGQKQRVAIARAILKKPKILILDEATSALDYKTEKMVKESLDRVSKDITTIIIAHRLSTIKSADNIIVLNKGKIAENGTHDELFNLKKLYYLLIKNQQTADNMESEKVVQNDHNNPNDELNKNQLIVETEMQVLNNQENNNNQVAIIVVKPEEIVHKIDDEDLPLKERRRLKEAEEKEREEKVKDAKKYLWPIMCQTPWTIIISTLSVCVQGVVWPTYGILLAITIEKLSPKSDSVTDMDKVESNGAFLAGMYLILATAAGVSGLTTGALFSILGENLARIMRLKCYEKYLRLDMGFFDIIENSPGSLLAKLAYDTLKINGISLSMLTIIIENVVTLLVGVALGFSYCWQIAFIVLGCLPIIIISSVARMKLKWSVSTGEEINMKDLGNHLSESLTNTKSIFCYNMQDKVSAYYDSKVEEGRPDSCTQIFTNIVAGFSQLFTMGVYAICFYVGAVLVRDKGQDQYDFLKAMFSMIFSSVGIGMAQQYVGDLADAKKSLVSLYNVLNYPLKIDPYEGREDYSNNEIKIDYKCSENSGKINKIIANKENCKGKIEFRNVSFFYPTRPDIKVFNGLSFTINPGESAAFVGFSGSGKSTIIQLILRFYDVTEGNILVDDVDIKDYDLISYREQLGLVMQEPALFKTNVYNNIIYGKLNATDEEVISAAQKAMVPRLEQISKDDKAALPVSGGEKQRIAIARCMLRDPSILLLDEATSALDKSVEEEVQKSLDILMKNRTSVVIAHRLSTTINSSIIFYLEKGNIIEQGSHNDLLKLEGRYYSLYKTGGQDEHTKNTNNV